VDGFSPFTSQGLPPGLEFRDGANHSYIEGTAPPPGTYTFTLVVGRYCYFGGCRCTYTNTFTLIVAPQVGAPQITGFSPSSGPAGTRVTIDGVNLQGITNVLFGGIESQNFGVASSNQVLATVPDSALTGLITLSGTNGIVSSSNSFTVGPARVHR
jgi:hypothetical protein